MGENLGTTYHFPSGQTAAGWHTYGMSWQPGSVHFYIDDPANIYARYTPASLSSLKGAVWPFDSGNGRFFILNLAVGGSWPGNPNRSTPFPAEMLVDYVRVYSYGNPVQAIAAPASRYKAWHDEVIDPGRHPLTRPAPADQDAVAGHPLPQGGEGWAFTQTLRAREE
jgi:beta-glucanase (GH16 family)